MTYFEKTVSADEYFREYVDIPKFAGYCAQCPNYGTNWSCSPFDFDPADIWKSYSALRVIACKVYTEPGMSLEEAGALLQKAKDGLMEYCYGLEAEIPGSMSLFAGRCCLCAECARPEGKPCRNPGRMRHSIEAIGGDVGKTVKDLFDIDIIWGKPGLPPEYYVLCGGLLMK